MPCWPYNERWTFDGDLEVLGVTFHKPSLGKGHGRTWHYIRWHRKNDYIAYFMVGERAMNVVLNQALASGVTLNCNVLKLYSGDRWDQHDMRHACAFFKSEADVFVFKSFLSMVDSKLLTDNDTGRNKYTYKPYFGKL